ncbi:hypothetical protein [Nonomuraea sp. NPDC005650]|uniref:hypothetical protein n=1 Tax=Nonomuraea sp. NPDC005650 TaxID=3157045 RepID=UPI0033B03BF2
MDLDAARRAREATKGGPEPLVFGGREIAVLPAEFPLDVLEPLISGVNVNMAMLARTILDAIQGQDGQESGAAVASMAVDMIVMNPQLPAELLTAAKEMLRRLIGPGGYDAFIAQRPSREDVAAFVTFLFSKYGWGDAGDVLGESSSPADGSPGGMTSIPTSETISEGSTSTASGPILANPASSGYADSLPTVSGSHPPLS